MYADKQTKAMAVALSETDRRREIQRAYNEEHGITPETIVKGISDISEFLMRTGGRLGIVQQIRLLATRSRYRRDAVLIIKGTVPAAQGQGYLTALSRELLRNLQAGGYRTMRSTFVGVDNPASAAQYVRMGGRPLHGTTFYRRDVA